MELAHLMLTQKACFNSPVWFNVGVPEARGYGWVFDKEGRPIGKLEPGVSRPQCSACFIVSVKDSLESILDLAKTEGMLFKWGSGTGTNLSALREENAILSGGGRASGPLSFMKGFDAFAGVIKSGGKTRRAAKMVILNADHPDIERFVGCKAKEEKKAYALVDAGYDASLDGEAYSSIFFQNANNSVRATDDFMEAAVADGPCVKLVQVAPDHIPMRTVESKGLTSFLVDFNQRRVVKTSLLKAKRLPASPRAHLQNSHRELV